MEISKGSRADLFRLFRIWFARFETQRRAATPLKYSGKLVPQGMIQAGDSNFCSVEFVISQVMVEYRNLEKILRSKISHLRPAIAGRVLRAIPPA